MTIEQLRLAKEMHDKSIKLVERIASIHQNHDNTNHILDSIHDSAVKQQYEAYLTDPRRI